MNRETAFLRSLLNRFDKDSLNSAVAPLPVEEAQEILNSDIDSQKPEAFLNATERAASEFHYSWIAPKIKNFKPELKSLILGSLPQHEREKISGLTGIPIRQPASDAGKRFLLGLLIPKFEVEGHLPPELLPPAPLNALLDMKKNKLVQLIDLLGLYDLGEKIRHIVDKRRLEQIDRCLSPEKKKFLRFAMRQIERVQISELDLSDWDGSEIKLSRMVHKSGLSRLSKALSGNHPDLIWHLAHRLDTGRGAILQRSAGAKAIEGITPVIAEQVVQIIKLLTPKRRSEP